MVRGEETVRILSKIGEGDLLQAFQRAEEGLVVVPYHPNMLATSIDLMRSDVCDDGGSLSGRYTAVANYAQQRPGLIENKATLWLSPTPCCLQFNGDP